MVCKISVFNIVKCQRSQCAYQVIYRTFIPSFLINPQMYTGGGDGKLAFYLGDIFAVNLA